MPGESYFMAFGGLGLSLAGFAGLIAALNPSGAGVAVTAYRLRTIVILGFILTFVGFGSVALYTATDGALDLTVRAATVLMLIAFMRGLIVDVRPGPVWASERARRATIGVLVAFVAVTLGNLVVASVGYLQLLMLLGLVGPVTIFYNTIRDATGGALATAAAPPGDSEGR